MPRRPRPQLAFRPLLKPGRALAPTEPAGPPEAPAAPVAYAELHAHSNFSLLDGAAHPDELVGQAAALGYRALALCDRDGLYGVVRAHDAARAAGLKLIVGADVTVAGGRRVTLLCRDRAGYARLSGLITKARLSHPKGTAEARVDDVAAAAAGLVCLAQDPVFAPTWRDVFGDAFYLELTNHLGPGDDERLGEIARAATRLDIPTVATGDVRYHVPERHRLYDVLVCTREKTTLDRAGRLLAANAERYLKPPAELARLFAAHPGALARTVEIADRCAFSLEELRCRFPEFPLPAGTTAPAYLRTLVAAGAAGRYGAPIGDRVRAQLEHELRLIEKLSLCGYFLIVWDIVRFARERGILCQGRGSAANSAVCYALGITAVDPVGMDLLFERFLSEERAETPDIDLDIEHARREEVIQYVYEKYGRDHAAMACEVITYRGRSAVRDVGKALGLSLKQVDRAAKAIDESMAELPQDPEFWRHLVGLDPGDPRVDHLGALTATLAGFPRHLGIHVGGMVVTDRPVADVVPVENATMEARTVTQWDKDDLGALGIIKIDLLGLGMLTLLSKAIALVAAHEGKTIDLARLPMDDPAVYDLICQADTIGVFQIESRAQMNMLPRMKPRCFYDLVIEVAIIRPGPIQGDMVHPFLRRRDGKEAVTYPHPSLEPVLARTLGIPLFQEQGMKLAIVAAGFTPGEADELRRAMGHKRSHERMAALKQRLVDGMARNAIGADVAERIYQELSAFADYGFPESHAASFALLVYASAYLKRYHPAAFYAALLNAQPMGFYAPNTIVQDGKRHGVKFLPVSVRRSGWDCTLERAEPGGLAVRLGVGLVRGLGDAKREAYEQGLAGEPPKTLRELAQRTKLPRIALERLAAIGALRAFAPSRRDAVWDVQALAADDDAGLLAAAEPEEAPPPLAPMDQAERLAADFGSLGLSVESHPVALWRPRLKRQGVLRASEVARAPAGAHVKVAGLAIVRQRPGTAKGMVFITIEDETGLVNLVLTPQIFARFRAARDEVLLLCEGRIERAGDVVNVRVTKLESLAARADVPGAPVREFR
ncbi:MAG TPA: error-prone DNA polymerase [Polyangia bacterium]|jgi:error-prone DNA polymerase